MVRYFLTLVCCSLVVGGSAATPVLLRVATAAEASPASAPIVSTKAPVDGTLAPEPTPFTLDIQPAALPPAPAAASPAIPAAAQPQVGPSRAADTGVTPTTQRGSIVIAPWKPSVTAQPAAVRTVAPQPDLLTFQGGSVERTGTVSYSIFWKPATSAYTSPNYQTLLNRYFQDIGGSPFYGMLSEYSDGGGSIVNSSTLGGTWTDLTAYPSNTPTYPANTLTDGNIRESVVRAMTANNWWPAPGVNANFFVYTAAGEESCFAVNACSTNYFCAYHTNFQVTHGGRTLDIKYANQPYDGNHLNGCGTPASPNADFDADSEINSTSHEHFEMVTDPDPRSGWVDINGNEIGDKCFTSYGALDGQGADVSLNGHPYIIQQEWSNLLGGCAMSPPPNFRLTTLRTTGTGAGSISSSPSGINCGAVCSASFLDGTVVTLTATSAQGSIFTGWSGACAGTGPCTVTMGAAQSATAIFNGAQFCTARPPVGVSVTPSGAGRLRVTISAASNIFLQSIQFGSATNALIDIGAGPVAAGNFTTALAASTQQTTFFVLRSTPGAATTAPLVVTDSCGSWSTFVGGGVNAP